MESEIVDIVLKGLWKRVIKQRLFSKDKVITCEVSILGIVVFYQSKTFPLTMSDKFFMMLSSAAKNAVGK